MKVNTKITAFIAVFILTGLMFYVLNTNFAHGIAPPGPPGQVAGCCTTADGGGQCVGCPEGGTCLSTGDFCESEGGFFEKGACSVVDGSASCGGAVAGTGCCVIEPGSCVSDISGDSCFSGEFSEVEIFVAGAACSEVPQCTITRNIPTMSNWGLIALAAVFVLAGIWAITRKKAQA